MNEYKQPHEDIVGIDRSGDWLLSLNKKAVAHRDALIAMAAHLYAATLVGNPAPVVRRMADRIRVPQIGDLVVEDGARYPRRDPEGTRRTGFGYFVARRVEWAESDEDYAAYLVKEPSEVDYPRGTDTAWYVQFGPEPQRICRWVNCSFITVPIDLNMFREPVGTPDGNGVTITRNDLLGSLADSGFQLNLPQS